MSGIPAGAGSLLGKQLGKYEILALLALGGTAEIYLARIGGAAGFEKYVVVKCLHDHLNDDQDFVRMFLDEARIAAQLDHSNIVQTTELGEHDGRYYMVMEFLAGLSLAMIVRRCGERLPNGRIPVPLALNMLAQACAGLHYAHERTINGKNLNIVHRDISPQNLVVSFEGVVKVVDFGIAKADQRETKTRSGTIKGKFAYMSPEQCVAQNVDRRTDVFALGVILHELLTGKRLFKRPSPYETYQAVIDCAVVPPSQLNHELDPALDAIVLKALAKDKDQRYATAEALGDAIAGYLHSRGKGSGPGDVARFFEASFATEIDEHGARMRDLISGRDSIDQGMGWGDDEEDAKNKDDNKRRETVDLTPAAAAAAFRSKGAADGDKSMELGTQDLIMRPSSGSLSEVIDDLGVKTGDRSYDQAFDDSDAHSDDDEGQPAEKTRIESNPLELLAELEKQKAAAPPGAAKQPATPPAGGAAIPSITGKPMPTIPKGPLSGSRPVAAPAAPAPNPLQPKLPPSGPLPLPPVPAAPTVRGGGAAASGTAVPVGNGKFLAPAQLPTMIADLDESSQTGSGPAKAPARPYDGLDDAGETQMEPVGSFDGETVMGANRPPMGGMANGMAPPPAQGYPQQQQQSSPAQGYPQQQQQSSPLQTGPQPFQAPPPPLGYPTVQPGYQSGYLAPSTGALPQQVDSGVFVNPAPNANLMSPVGAQYPQQVDWEAAAAAPARALPSWLMGAIFVGAIGLALVLTIVIARLVSHHH